MQIYRHLVEREIKKNGRPGNKKDGPRRCARSPGALQPRTEREEERRAREEKEDERMCLARLDRGDGAENVWQNSTETRETSGINASVAGEIPESRANERCDDPPRTDFAETKTGRRKRKTERERDRETEGREKSMRPGRINALH